MVFPFIWFITFMVPGVTDDEPVAVSPQTTAHVDRMSSAVATGAACLVRSGSVMATQTAQTAQTSCHWTSNVWQQVRYHTTAVWHFPRSSTSVSEAPATPQGKRTYGSNKWQMELSEQFLTDFICRGAFVK